MITALVTGASGGIGSQIALRLSTLGYAVALHCNENEDAALELLANLAERGRPALVVRADLTKPDEVDAMLKLTHERLGKVRLLVNCAGVALPQKLLTDCTPQELSHVIGVNVTGTLLVCRAVIPDMSEGGCIVNISSIWGLRGGSCEVAYSASKAAIAGLTRALAVELAPMGIRVNCVAPGLIGTKMNAQLTAEELCAFVEELPLGRMGHPADVAQAVEYLVRASYVTGQVLAVDGGFTA